MCKIPEPWEVADAHYARLEEERRKMLEEAICGDCDHYYAAPDKWTREPCGWCGWCGEFVRHGDSVAEYGCEDFKPRG